MFITPFTSDYNSNVTNNNDYISIDDNYDNNDFGENVTFYNC